jgi:hypothetical protein
MDETKKKVKVVIKIKRPKQKQQPRKIKVIRRNENDLLARSHFDSKMWNDFFDSCRKSRAIIDSVKIDINFDPEITLSPKWRSQFHYPEADTDTSEWIVKDEDYVSTIDTSSI